MTINISIRRTVEGPRKAAPGMAGAFGGTVPAGSEIEEVEVTLPESVGLAGIDTAITTAAGAFSRAHGQFLTDALDEGGPAIFEPVTFADLSQSETAEPLDATAMVLEEIAAERRTHEGRGYDAEHDDHHGTDHLLGEVVRKINGSVSAYPEIQRRKLVVAASLLVAALELLDRKAEKN